MNSFDMSQYFLPLIVKPVKICRICLLIDENHKDIFDILESTRYGDLDIKERLELFGGIEISRENGLPNYICDKCIEKVMNDNFGLWEQCHYAEQVINESRIKFTDFGISPTPVNQPENDNQLNTNTIMKSERYLTSGWRPFPYEIQLIPDSEENLIVFRNHGAETYKNYWTDHNSNFNVSESPNNDFPNTYVNNLEYLCKNHKAKSAICGICKSKFINTKSMIFHLYKHINRNIIGVYEILKKFRAENDSKQFASNTETDYEVNKNCIENDDNMTNRTEKLDRPNIWIQVDLWIKEILASYQVLDSRCSVCQVLLFRPSIF